MSYVMPILIVFATGAVPALIFILLLRIRLEQLIPLLLLILVILGAVFAVLLLYGMGLFGMGPSCLTVPVAASALIVLVGARALFLRSIGEDKSRRRWYLIGLFLIPFLQVAPLLEQFLLVGACDAWNRHKGDAIVRALEAYKQDHLVYPADVEALAPTYIPELPTARCFSPFRWFGGSDAYQGVHAMSSLWIDGQFKLHECSTEQVKLLIVPSVLVDSIQRYNPKTGEWSRTSLLDGTCASMR